MNGAVAATRREPGDDVAAGHVSSVGRRVPRPRDIAIAVVGAALDVLVFSAILSVPPAAGALIVGYAVVGHAAVVWRSAAPVVVFVIVWTHAVAAYVLIPDYGPIVGLLISLYTVAARCGARVSLVALGSMVVPHALRVVEELSVTRETGSASVIVAGGLLLAAIDAGVWSAGRWSSIQAERAQLLERERDRVAREAVRRERVQVARDLHDVISHSVSVMSLQAAGAQSLMRDRPERAEQALSDIRSTAGQAMVELRRLLVLLRDEDDPEPQPAAHGRGGIGELDALLRGVRAAGVRVRLRTTGLPRPLDAGADLTVYRVVQEALTNVVGHAGVDVEVGVSLTWRDVDVEVEVRNTAPESPRPAPATGGGGRGLIGMRERVDSVGGSLAYGPVPDGGFRVRATIPVHGSDP